MCVCVCVVPGGSVNAVWEWRARDGSGALASVSVVSLEGKCSVLGKIPLPDYLSKAYFSEYSEFS